MSAGCQAKMSLFSRRNSTSALSYLGSRFVPMATVLEASPTTSSTGKVNDSEMPASKKQISDSAPAFKAAIETKPVELVVGDASKTTAIGTNLDPK